jgi:hypothetical protein
LIRVYYLAALSQCRKLVRLDLSLIRGTPLILDLLRAVSTLSCLKIFHFPRCSSAAFYLSKEDDPKWPDSLETFHIPCSLDKIYIPAFENPPISLKSLVIEDDFQVTDVLDVVFGLIGSQILTVKVQYEEDCNDQLAMIFINFPNLLHLSIPPDLISDDATADIYLGNDYPLLSLTVILQQPDDIFDPYFLEFLEYLLDDDLLPNIRRLVLSHASSVDSWNSFLHENPLPVKRQIELLDIDKRLKRRSSSASCPRKSGVWLVDCEDNDVSISEFTDESLVRVILRSWSSNMIQSCV